MIDLHCHSTCSDGELTPAQLLDLAAETGIEALALTDHDTVDGIDAFVEDGLSTTVEAIPGVEVACRGPKSMIIHLVGLWCEHRDPSLLDLLEGIRAHRRDRNLKMVDRLAELGCPLAWSELSTAAGKGVMGRPHFAKMLVEKGFCRTPREAFDRFLARGKPAYIRRSLPTAAEALETLSQAGAVCIWAHPLMSNSVTGAALQRIAESLLPYGLDGIECFYSVYSENQTRKALRHTRELGLLVSGGSDFHGQNIPGIALGTGRGKLCIPAEILDPLRQRAAIKQRRDLRHHLHTAPQPLPSD